MSQVVVGTSGHIDHGKTSLVKALTGTNTDCLEQEKKRGMTIDLGFAYLNESITIIDVPGHEKFIRNMAAGAANIHFGLIVIAADDGIMPQTIEHIEILTLLGVNKGCVALTKIDLIEDREWIDLVELDITELLEIYGFDFTIVHRINNLTGDGIESLKIDIQTLANKHKAISRSSQFRLNVDRFFSKTGFGTVVTGTIISGEVKNGTDVEIFPNGLKTKIRGIQTHGGIVDKAETGDRAALNLANVKSYDLSRGTVIATPKSLRSTIRIIAHIKMTKSTQWAVKNKQRLRFHFGTSEVLGRCFGEKIESGQSKNFIIDLESPIAVAMDDKFVIRSYSPLETIAGGLVLDPNPFGKWSELKSFAQKLPYSPKERFLFLIDDNWKTPKMKNDWGSLFFISAEILAKWIKELNIYENENELLYTKSGFEKSQSELINFFKISYQKNPFRTIISSEGILAKLKWSEEWLKFVIKRLTKSNKLILKQGGYSLNSFKPEFSASDIEDLKIIKSLITRSGIEPILLKDISGVSGFNPNRVGDLVHLLHEKNEIENLGKNFWMDRSILDKLIQDIQNYFQSNIHLSVTDFKDITNLSRKTAIPLLEYLDKKQFTVRKENVRYKGDAFDG